MRSYLGFPQTLTVWNSLFCHMQRSLSTGHELWETLAYWLHHNFYGIRRAECQWRRFPNVIMYSSWLPVMNMKEELNIMSFEFPVQP